MVMHMNTVREILFQALDMEETVQKPKWTRCIVLNIAYAKWPCIRFHIGRTNNIVYRDP